MGSRGKKILSMVPVQHNNLKVNNTFVENWLANFHPEDQDSEYDLDNLGNLEASRFSINNITSTSCDTKNELPAIDRSTIICDNDVNTVLIQEVNVDAILPNTVIENVATKDIEKAVIIIDSKRFNLSDDEEKVSSKVVITETTLAKTMLRQGTISNPNEMSSGNNEDFSGSDGSDYEPPQKRVQKKVFNFDSFYDLKLLSNDINLNTGKNIDGETIRISDVKVVKFIKDSDTYLYKTTYKSERWQEAKIKISRAGKKNISDIHLSAAYSSKLPIANNKKLDIRQLITANIVPKYYENTYNSLFE